MKGLDLSALHHRDNVGSHEAAAGVELVGGQLAAGLQVDADVARSKRPFERLQKFFGFCHPFEGRCDKHPSYVRHRPLCQAFP